MKRTKKFEVTVTREIRHTATIEVEAATMAEAQLVAVDTVDAPQATYWREGDVLAESFNVRPL